MLKVEHYERIRRAYYVEGKSQRQIAEELGHSRRTIGRALQQAAPSGYTLQSPRSAPVLGPYKDRIGELLAANEQLPPKQRYTGRKIYEVITSEGYTGSEVSVRGYLAKLRQAQRQPMTFLPLEYEPGRDGQVDWGEAEVIMGGKQVTVQLFVMRLCYSRRLFVMAFPTQRQEAFFAGHVAAFRHFEGVPQRLSYDNLSTAVRKVLRGRQRIEQDAFIALRSHYLFESHFCTPGQGHEKGQVEGAVGYARRNFLVPLPEVADFDQLNAYLLACCERDDQRQVARQSVTIGEAWVQERPQLQVLPDHDYDCCRQREAKLNPYSQVVLETNRYSVPTDRAETRLRVKLYPFRVEIYGQQSGSLLAVHPRCYQREQDILDPLHYLPLLLRRPGALDYTQPVREWRASWPPVYEQALAQLQAHWPDGRGVREFIRILQFHQDYHSELVAHAVELALAGHCLHADGVQLYLTQLSQPEPTFIQLDLSEHPQLQDVGTQTITLDAYNQLLTGGSI